MRKWLGLAAVVLLAAAGWWQWQKGQGANKVPQIRFDSVKVDRGPIVAKVTASGTLSARVTVQIGSQVSGRIAQLHADYNDRVTKGQVLARLDPLLFQTALDQAKASEKAAKGDLARAKAQAKEARKLHARNQQLASQQLIASAEVDTSAANADVATASVQAAEGRLAQAQAARRQAETNIGFCTITSPIDGMVLSRAVDVGQTVAASLQAPVLYTLVEDLARMQVDTWVAESDVGKLQAGMAASFTVDAFPGKRFAATVRQIRNASQTQQNVVTYDAVLDVENPELLLRPGMTATVTFVYAERQDVLRVANAALRFRPSQDLLRAMEVQLPDALTATSAPLRRVWQLQGNKAKPVAVDTGLSNGAVTELLEPKLAPGTVLVIDAALPQGNKPSAPMGMGAPMGGSRRM